MPPSGKRRKPVKRSSGKSSRTPASFPTRRPPRSPATTTRSTAADAGEGSRGREYGRGTRDEESPEGTRGRTQGGARGTPGLEEEQSRRGGRRGRDGQGREETSGCRRKGGVPPQARRGGRNPCRVARWPAPGTRRPREVSRRAPRETRRDESRCERGAAGNRIVPHEARGAR